MQGLKRAADGSVKGSNVAVDSSAIQSMGHKRNKSMEAGSNGRIGQVRKKCRGLKHSLRTP